MNRPVRVLALDLGISKAHPTGWAWCVGDVVQSGQLTLENRTRKTRGRRWEHFRDWLEAMVEEVGPDLVAFEMPPVFKGGFKGRLSLLGLVVLIEEVATRWGIEFRPVAPASMKKSVAGSGRASKDEVQVDIEQRYPDQAPFLGADQVDALAVLEWARTDVLGLAPRGKAGEQWKRYT